MVMSDMILPIGCRLYVPATDYGFVKATWISSAKDKLAPQSMYYIEEGRKIDKLLNIAQTMIAYIEDEPNIILSFINYGYELDNLIIHYAFTKSLFRKQGIQNKLINIINIGSPIVLTCRPNERIFKSLKNKYNIIYDYAYFTRGNI